jgi:tetratricopeptide (TPR) repeat protein
VLGRKVKALKDGEQIAVHKLRIAALYENNLNDTERAAQTYREVLEVDGASLAAMRGLERIYTQKSSWQELVGVLEQELDVVTSERERIDILMKLATIQEEQFLKADLAAARLEQVLEIDASHEPALVALERCYRRLRQWLDLINTYDRHINATHDRLKVDLYWRHGPGLRRRSRTSITPSTRTATSSISTTRTSRRSKLSRSFSRSRAMRPRPPTT